MGETVAPYLHLEVRKAILPLSSATGELVRSDGGSYGLDPTSLEPRMRRRWRLINRIWEQSTDHDNRRTLLDSLDYVGKLSAQRSTAAAQQQRKPYAVVYTASGHPIATVIKGFDAVIDYTLFWILCRSKREAEYLTAVINSRTVERVLEPLMPKGQFGSRHVMKHIWRLPIPEYDEAEALHRKIATAARNAAAGAERVLSDVRAQRAELGKPTTVKIARREIRKWLEQSEEGQEVERLVAQLLG